MSILTLETSAEKKLECNANTDHIILPGCLDIPIMEKDSDILVTIVIITLFGSIKTMQRFSKKECWKMIKMKPETKRRIKNLIKLLSKGADVEFNGNYRIVKYVSKPVMLSCSGINDPFCNELYTYLYESRCKFGKVLMP